MNREEFTPEKEILSSLEERAARHYSDEMPYHNFSHVEKSRKRGQEIVTQCQKENVPINRRVVDLALLFHDAGHHLNHTKLGYKTKEELHAALARKELEEAGVEENIIVQVEEAIKSTHRDAPFNTNEAKAVRAADISTMAGPYDEFIEVNKKLKAEQEMVTGQKISWADWKQKTKELIEFYLKQDIHLTSAHEDEEGKSVFHEKTRQNLERFLKEDESKLN